MAAIGVKEEIYDGHEVKLSLLVFFQYLPDSMLLLPWEQLHTNPPHYNAAQQS